MFPIISGQVISRRIIISLHGGPGSPTTYIDYCWQDYLTDEYTVVSWDERGCGRSYYRNIDTDPDNATLSFDQQLKDLDGMGIVFYSPQTNKDIPVEYDFLGEEYTEPVDVANHIKQGDMVGFCTMVFHCCLRDNLCQNKSI